MPLILEGCAAVRVPDGARTKELRQRFLAVLLDGPAAPGAGALPGPPPGAEVSWRWGGGLESPKPTG